MSAKVRRTAWVWPLVILAMLGCGLIPDLADLAALLPDAATPLPSATATATPLPPATATSVPALPAAETQAPAAAVFDEQQAAQALQALIIEVYDRASPAVVNVTNRSYVYYHFMGAVPEEGTGSGFVYDAEGHIVTNYHVVENAEELLVTLAGGEVYQAELVGSDPANDLAVLHVDAGDNLPAPLEVGDSDQLRVGQSVLAIGNPYGLQQTLTTGVVSALGRVIESPESNNFIGEAIQTDAAINPGNSGGPLLNLQSQVVGVNSQIISPSGASAGIGFAVSANTVRRVVPQLIENGYYAHPWLGADMLPLSSSVADLLREGGVDLPIDHGLLVLTTTTGGPADRAGIRGGDQWLRIRRYQLPVGGDIITAIDGQPTEDLQTLMVYLEAETHVGDTVELTIVRGKDETVVPVTLAEQPR